MSPPTTAPPTCNDRLRLPRGAPRLRVTIGAGSASQKTWALRRPVTLIGSRRKAQLFLQHPEVSKAHCVIINTGSDILLRDLASKAGTFLNGEPVELVPLTDGDVIRVGPTHIQVAIQANVDENQSSEAGLVYAEPTAMPFDFALQRQDAADRWELSRSVSLIGRREEADVFLDHADISLAHAIIFHVAGRPAIYDLASRTGTWVNGVEQVGVGLGNGSVLRLGPFELQVETTVEAAEDEPGHDDPDEQQAAAPGSVDSHEETESELLASHPAENAALDEHHVAAADPLAIRRTDDEPVGALANLESKISALQQDIAQSWQRLAQQQKELDAKYAELAERERVADKAIAETGQREEAISARTADLEKRLREFESKQARLDAERNALESKAAQLEARRNELDVLGQQQEASGALIGKRAEELKSQRAELDQAAEKLKKQQQEIEEREDTLAARHAEIVAAEKELAGLTKQIEAKRQEFEAAQNSVNQERSQIDADRVALAEQQSKAKSERQEIEARERELQQRQASVEAVQQETERDRAHIEELLAQLSDRQQALTKEQERMAQARSELEALRADVASKSKGLKSQEDALADKLANIATADERLSKEREAIEERRREVETQAEEMGAKEQALAERTASLNVEAQQLETSRAELAEQQTEWQARRDHFDRREKALAERDAELDRRVTELAERQSAMERFREALDIASRAFLGAEKLAAEAPARPPTAAPPEPPVDEHPHPASTDERSPDGRATETSDTSPKFVEAPAPPPAPPEEEPSPEDEHGHAEQPAAAPGRAEPHGLDPAAASRFRMLRRLSPNTPDEELLTQVSRKAEQDAARDGGKGKKRGWWRR